MIASRSTDSNRILVRCGGCKGPVVYDDVYSVVVMHASDSVVCYYKCGRCASDGKFVASQSQWDEVVEASRVSLDETVESLTGSLDVIETVEDCVALWAGSNPRLERLDRCWCSDCRERDGI